MLDLPEAIDRYETCLHTLLDQLATNEPLSNGNISNALQDALHRLLEADKRYSRGLVEAKQHMQQSEAIRLLQEQEAKVDASLADGLGALRTIHTELRQPLPSSREPGRLQQEDPSWPLTGAEGDKVSKMDVDTLMRYARTIAKTASAPRSYDPTTHSASASALFPWPSEDMMRRGAGRPEVAEDDAVRNEADAAMEEAERPTVADPTILQAQHGTSQSDQNASGLDLDLFDPDQEDG